MKVKFRLYDGRLTDDETNKLLKIETNKTNASLFEPSHAFRAVKMPRGGGDTKVFLGNLPPDCKVSDIQQFLDKFGRVRNILIKQGKYGFAEFDDPRDADDAVYELHGRKLLGSRITLEFAKVGSDELNTLKYLDGCSGP